MENIIHILTRDFREWEERERNLCLQRQYARRRGRRPGTRLYDRITIRNAIDNEDLFRRIRERREETNTAIRQLRNYERRLDDVETELNEHRIMLRDTITTVNQMVDIHRNIDLQLQNRRVANLVVGMEYLMQTLHPRHLRGIPDPRY